jgi:DNA-binding LacI/PurR family transcriptional regulator
MKNMKKIPEKVEEVAAHFGLSRSTISYILNNKWESRRISDATAKKVWNYVKEKGFQPNILGLALRGKTVKEIAVIIPVDPLEHHKHAFFRLIKELEKNQKSYIVLPVSDRNIVETVQFIKMYRVKKLVFIAYLFNENNLVAWKNAIAGLNDIEYFLYDFPFERVKIGNMLKPGNNIAVGFNRKHANQKIFEYIIDSGYKNLIVPQSWNQHLLETIKVKSGYRLETYNFINFESLLEKSEHIASQLIKMVEPGVRKAVYVNDDHTTFAIIKYLLDRGVKIPLDMAFISWDGLPESDYFSIPLTTLEVPHEKMMAYTIDWINGRKIRERKIIIDAGIKQGESLPPVR